MKQEMRVKVGFVIAICILAVIALGGISLTTMNAIGANLTNSTVRTRVNVTNTEPIVYAVSVSPTPIDPNPGGTVSVICNGSAYDYNGGTDIKNVSAKLYHTSYGDGVTSDNNFRYINSSCTNASGGANCQSINGASNNVSCICGFSVWYYANSGSWVCNMTVGDRKRMNSSMLSEVVTINPTVGIDVPSEIDFGNLSVSELSGHIRENVTNWGNVPINTSIRGYGGLIDNNNLSMICNLGNITNTYLRYSINNSMIYEKMNNITNISTTINSFTIPARTNDATYGNSSNATFWKLQVPLSVGGYCNGTIIFSAIDAR